MTNTNIKIYKDNSTKELIISLGPTDSSLEQLVVQFLSKACSVNIEEIDSLQEDKVYIEQESDISYAQKVASGEEIISMQDGAFTQNEQKKTEEQTEQPADGTSSVQSEYIMKSGKYNGMTPLQALKEKDAFVPFMSFCQKNANNPECASLTHYVSALLTYIQENNVNEMSEEVLQEKLSMFRTICPNVVQHYEQELDFSNIENVRTVVNKCYYSAYKFLSSL